MSNFKHHHARILSAFALFTALAAGCNKAATKSDESATSEAKSSSDSGPCAGARALAGVVVLEVKKDKPDNVDDGVKFIQKLEADLAAECTSKGYDKSAVDALACYDKNKSKRGYFVLKGCDDKPGKELIAAVVAKHGGK